MAKGRQHTFSSAVEISLGFILILWGIEGADYYVMEQTRGRLSLDMFGIVPRTNFGLVGILCSPLLHANWAHLIANTVPLFITMVLLYWDKHYYPNRTFWLIWIVSGIGTWLIGRGGSVHIGASSLIFGLVSYLIVAGFLMRSWRSAIISFVVLLCFGGIFYGVLPQRGPISWEGHLCGALAGIWAARRNHE